MANESTNRLSQEDQYLNSKLRLKMQTGVLLLVGADGKEITRTPGSPTGKVVDYTATTYPAGQRLEQIGDLELDAQHHAVTVPVDSALDLLSKHPIGNDAVTAAHNLVAARVTVNEEDIDDLETSKVNVADIIDDLTHTDTDKPLSAKQGMVLKELIDTAVSEFFNAMHPVGSYAFGAVAPTRGTWEEVTGDRALWLRNTALDGTLISEGLPQLPEIEIQSLGSDHVHGIQCLWQQGEPNTTGSPAQRIIFGRSTAADWGQTKAGIDEGAHTHRAKYELSEIYGESDNVQPNAYVIKVWKRVS